MESATPLPLRWIEEFVNTRRADGDDLVSPTQLWQWLTTRDLAPASTGVAAADVSRALSVREGLRALIADNNAEPVASPRSDGLDPSARDHLSSLTTALPLTVDVTTHPPQITPQAGLSVVDSALATLLVAVVASVGDGTWSRLKACREPSCRWAFYDHSRNRSRSWCSMDRCGNRAKARAFYERSLET